MGQIYKVFVNNKALTVNQSIKKEAKNWESNDIELLIQKLEMKDSENVSIECSNPEDFWRKLMDLHQYIEAAGGVVYNQNGDLLIIERLGKWDLPKGKLEEGEDIEECAVREVMEECGIERLQLGEELDSTYHTYTHKGRRMLKRTYWYRMQSSDTKELIPQAEEDITQALWMNPSGLTQVLENTYASIAELLKEEKESYLRNS